jgi:steroid 5-alpha reductase family enzyme
VNIAIIAALGMLVQDVLGTCMVQAQNRSRGWIAGFCDAGMWLMALFSYDKAITSTGHERLLVIVLVTLANLVGNRLGVYVGNRWVKEQSKCTCCKVHHVADF